MTIMWLSTNRKLAGIVAAAALALIALYARRATDDRSAAQQQARDGVAAGSVASVSLSVVPDPAAEQIPGAHCWQGLLDVDRAATLSALRGVLARALASGDELLATYVSDRLVELVGADVARAGELLEWATQATGQEAQIVYGALARTAAIQNPAIADRVLRAGEDRSTDEVRRASAIAALETQARLAPEKLSRVAAVALDPDANGVAWTATRTIGRVMKEDFTRTGEYAPYMDQLLDISARTTDPAVRVLALEMPAYADPVLGPAYIDELAKVLTTAPEREVREMAAFQLGLTSDPNRVLEVFRSAFPREQELCVRWSIVRFSVRAAGARAMPVLDELARIDSRFAIDVADFRKIYATGVEDFERVWLDKTEHHPCTADGDDHGGES